MNKDKAKIIVYYDGACPKCVRDRHNYEKLAGKTGEDVCWLDITGKYIAGSAAAGVYDISGQLPAQFHRVLYIYFAHQISVF